MKTKYLVQKDSDTGNWLVVNSVSFEVQSAWNSLIQARKAARDLN